MTGEAYVEAKGIAKAVARAMLSARGLRVTADRLEEVAHDATLEVLEREDRTGRKVVCMWQMLRFAVGRQLGDPKVRRREADTLDETFPDRDEGGDETFAHLYERHEGIRALAAKCGTMKKFFSASLVYLTPREIRRNCQALASMWREAHGEASRE